MAAAKGRPSLTAVDSLRALTRTEALEMVIGSGRKGQSYLYWYHGLLFELPVSYLTAANQWINSPGDQDGTASASNNGTATKEWIVGNRRRSGDFSM